MKRDYCNLVDLNTTYREYFSVCDEISGIPCRGSVRRLFMHYVFNISPPFDLILAHTQPNPSIHSFTMMLMVIVEAW